MIIVNGFQPVTIITKRSILDVAVALDLPLLMHCCIIKNFSKHSPPLHLSQWTESKMTIYMTSSIFLGCVSIWMVLSCKPSSSLNRSFQVTIIKSVKKVLLNVFEALLSELQRIGFSFCQ